MVKKLTVFEYEQQLKREYAEKTMDWTLSKEEKRKTHEDYIKGITGATLSVWESNR
jgi:hypothetical protein